MIVPRLPTKTCGGINVDIRSLPSRNERSKVHNLLGYIKKTYAPNKIETKPYGCIDFETYTLEDGRQRAYGLGIYHPTRGYERFRRCDYLREEDYNVAIKDYFKRYPSIYFSLNGANFDHILLHRILSSTGERVGVKDSGLKIRSMRWEGNRFLDILYWTGPSSLADLAKTWLGKDLKDIFPHNAVKEWMVKDKDSGFGILSREDFPDKVKVGEYDMERFNEKSFWELSSGYMKNDVLILKDCLKEIEKMYNKIGYSITEEKFQGIASIAHDHGLRYIKGDEFKCFDKKLYDEWKSCYSGGICELNDLNLEQEEVNCYDINGLYTYVRLVNPYPIGEPVKLENPPIDTLNGLFGLIEAVVSDGNIPLGVPCKVEGGFNRLRGKVEYRGTTEELKSLDQNILTEHILE